MDGLPVVTADEMKRLETLAFEGGEDEQDYMEQAGKGIAAAAEEFLVTPRTTDTIYLLVGKGNNGGDAFVAGELLRKKGFSVSALCLHPHEECSKLSQKMSLRFVKAGGEMHQITTAPKFIDGDLILDGLVGTGFQGEAKGLLQEVIEAANQSDVPIFAIDIPSGLNGNTGEVETIAIQAEKTLYLGLPKIGFFLGEGWNHVGQLVAIDFGMPSKYIEKAKPTAHLISKKRAAKAFPPIQRTRHKYQAGYVLAIAGSPGMPGAALLSSFAALKSGAGIVRLFYPHKMKDELNAAPYELIKEGWDLKNSSRIFEEEKRAKAFLIGPGMGRTAKAAKALQAILAKTTLPCVLDADALYLLSDEMKLPEKVVLTPHHQEMERILGKEPTFAHCEAYVKEKKVTLVLKGAPTVIFHRHTKPLIIPQGDPGMATAGTGDVLTGIIASMLAQGLDLRSASALAVLLHGLSGEIAASHETSYGVIASDLIHFLPEAIQSL